jgi:hypothetical protein
MLTHMSSREFTYWQAYERVTGFLGQERDDILAAMVAERVTSMLQGKQKGKRTKQWQISDFIPKWGATKPSGERERMAPERMKDKLIALTKAFGGTVKHRDE